MPRGPTPEKSSVYHTLLDALLKRGCPVCQIMEEAAASHLDALYYEQVTDVGVRRKLRQARGLCSAHAGKTRKITTAALGVAIIAKDLLEEECTRLAELQPQAWWSCVGDSARAQPSRQALLAYLRGWQQRNICPVCQVVAAHERHALETVLNFLNDEEFSSRFEVSSGLCLPHLVRAVELNPTHVSLGSLVETQRRLFNRLRGELEEFCRKHDYRFVQEPWGAEADAWQRAIEVLAGKPGVFGSDILRRQSKRRFQFFQNLLSRWR